MRTLVDFVRTAKAETAINSANTDSRTVIEFYLEFFRVVLDYIDICFLAERYVHIGIPKKGFYMGQKWYFFEHNRLVCVVDQHHDEEAQTRYVQLTPIQTSSRSYKEIRDDT